MVGGVELEGDGRVDGNGVHVGWGEVCSAINQTNREGRRYDMSAGCIQEWRTMKWIVGGKQGDVHIPEVPPTTMV
jgi:hypothetical protein